MAHTEHLTIYWMQDKSGHRRRFGFVTSKKVGKAHDRNLVRRRLRHICAGCLESFIPGDYIFVARPGSAALSLDLLGQELLTAREMLYERIPKNASNIAAPADAPEGTTVLTDEVAEDASLNAESEIMTPAGTVQPVHPVSLAVRAIRVYQMISRNTPSTCRFYPTCSEYMAQAMLRHGAWRGFWMGIRRIARCHPFAKGGHDPVP